MQKYAREGAKQVGVGVPGGVAGKCAGSVGGGMRGAGSVGVVCCAQGNPCLRDPRCIIRTMCVSIWRNEAAREGMVQWDRELELPRLRWGGEINDRRNAVRMSHAGAVLRAACGLIAAGAQGE